jgi:hypothetical protein
MQWSVRLWIMVAKRAYKIRKQGAQKHEWVLEKVQ